MAISINYSPAAVQPVYQPFFFQVTSSQYTQPQFRFVFDVYKDGVFKQRVKMLPQPATAIAQFSPARILESYLSYDLTLSNSLPVQTNSIAQYQIQYGEEYGPITAAPVLYTNLNSSSGFTFNGTVQYKDYYWAAAGAVFNQYSLKSMSLYNGVGKFLTNSPTGLTIGTNDAHSLSVFNFNSTDIGDANVQRATILWVKAYQTSGGTTDSLIYYQANTGNTITHKEIHFPAGPFNLNTVPFGNFLSGSKYPPINTETDYKYTLSVYSNSYGPTTADTRISEIREFTFEDCGKYDNVRLRFLNRLGTWDYFNFRLVSRDYISSSKITYKKNLPISYYFGNSFADRETTVLNSTNQKTKKLTSNWVTDDESEWLEELWTSPEVYEVTTDVYGNQQMIPVVINSSSYEIKKRINDQIYNYEVDISYASEVNTQRN